MASVTEDIGDQKKQSFAHGHKTVQCVVVTPEKTLVDEPVEFVALPLFDGELGVLPGRAPLVGRLGYGELRTKNALVVRRYFVDGGFVQVKGDVVTVLTSRAIPAADLDPQAAARDRSGRQAEDRQRPRVRRATEGRRTRSRNDLGRQP